METERATAAVTDVVLSVLNSYGARDDLRRILSAVLLAVGADVAGYYGHEPRGWSTAICIVPDEAWSIIPFAQMPSSVVARSHPGIHHLLANHPEDPFAVTDLVPERVWQHSEMVSMTRSDWGRNYQFAIPATPGTETTEHYAWVLGRFRHNFSDADRAICVALSPVLQAVTRHRTALNRINLGSASEHLLTQRELVVLQLKADGLSARGIARRLSMSPRTAQKHSENIYRKLGVHSRHEAVRASELLGLTPNEKPLAES